MPFVDRKLNDPDETVKPGGADVLRFRPKPLDRSQSLEEVCGHGRRRAECEACERLDAISAVNGPWREGLAKRSARRADVYAALADAAKDAESARYLGAPPMSPEAIAELHAAFNVGKLVPRVRRRMVDKKVKGKARRFPETKTVEIPAQDAYASTSRWHEGRAKGQRSRGATVEHCGVGKIAVSCGGCGVVHEMAVYCGVVRLCQTCSKRRADHQRARLAISIPYVIENARRQGALLRYRKGGALTEKHLVLTVPHVDAEVLGPERRNLVAIERIEIIYAAWRIFSLSLQAFLRKSGSGKLGACFHRAFEWTPGRDGLGHPHFHVWMLSPFLPEYDDHPSIASIADGNKRSSTRCKGEGCDLCAAGHARRTGVRTWWTRALRQASQGKIDLAPADVILTVRKVFARAERIISEVQKPNGVTYQRRGTRLTVRAAGGDDLIGYLEGWSIAGFDDCEPGVIAGVERALEGKRLSQSSKVTLVYKGARVVKGLMAIADERVDGSCKDCVAYALKESIEWDFTDKRVDVVSWDRVLSRAWRAELPDSTGPPVKLPEESFTAFVDRLRKTDELTRVGEGARVRRSFEAIASVRELGGEGLPAYARRKVFKANGPLTFRVKMKIAAKARRKKQ